MTERPYVLVSCAVSIDGYIDDTSDQRLLLSNDADFDRVDEVRAGCDAIMVGAETIRRDNPRLLVRSEQRQQRRQAEGKASSPVKVTITAGGGIEPSAKFFTTGDVDKLVYTTTATAAHLQPRLGSVATVVDTGMAVDLEQVLVDLSRRGVRRLMVEGGGRIHTWFLTAGVVDELHLVIAPFFVGDDKAPTFVHPGSYPNGPTNPMRLAEARPIGDVVLLRYLSV